MEECSLYELYGLYLTELATIGNASQLVHVTFSARNTALQEIIVQICRMTCAPGLLETLVQ